MNTRETVFVSLMALAVSYGAVHTLCSNRPEHASEDSPQGAQERSLRFVADSRAQLESTAQDDDSAHIAGLIAQAWSNNPFATTLVRAKATVAPKAAIAVRYAGYLNVGGKRFALLNGNAYQSGDAIPESPYRILKIQSDRVVLADGDGDKTVSITIEDESKRGGK